MRKEKILMIFQPLESLDAGYNNNGFWSGAFRLALHVSSHVLQGLSLLSAVLVTSCAWFLHQSWGLQAIRHSKYTISSSSGRFQLLTAVALVCHLA